MVAGQRLDGLVLGGLALGDPGRMDQPGPGGPLPVGQVPVLDVEDLEKPGPDRGFDRVVAFQGPQLVRGGRGGQGGRVLGGQESQRGFLQALRGLQHGQRLGGGGRDRRGAHVLAHLPRGRIWMLFLIRPYPGGSDISGCSTTVFDYVFERIK